MSKVEFGNYARPGESTENAVARAKSAGFKFDFNPYVV